MKVKIIQFGIDENAEREILSSKQLQSISSNYIKVNNPRFTTEPPINDIFNGNTQWYVGLSKEPDVWGLIPSHYGCWLSHKQSIQIGFCEDEHFLVCESDCKILDMSLFKERLNEAINYLNNNNNPLVSFAEPNFRTNTTFFDKVSDNLIECDNLVNSHCYLVNKNSKDQWEWMFENIGWHAFDWWVNYAIEEYNKFNYPSYQLCFNERITHQFEGLSDIDSEQKWSLTKIQQ